MLGEVRREVRETTKGRQIPWENSALEGEFYFKPVAAGPAPHPNWRSPRPQRPFPLTCSKISGKPCRRFCRP